jgi:selenocysteine lyase/cysteine desulfurase
MLGAKFSKFRAADPARIHFAAHSHHPWPDATEAAHARYWQDSNLLADAKWDRVFGEVVPKAQAHIARIAKLSDPRLVAFAPNTHEFVTRLYSCLEPGRVPRVLTTGSEFHSFRRQTRRLKEAGLVHVEEIPTAPWDTFVERFVAAERRGDWDMVWLSHVFYDSAFIAADLDAICDAAPARALVCIDGYHALCAIPIDLARVHRRAFYLGGGYKYAMAGEGAAYLAIPPGCELRPIDTGWFASFDTLSTGPGDAVSYAPHAMRFMGATFDPCGVYRFNASMDMLVEAGVDAQAIHRHSTSLQKHFLDGLLRLDLKALTPGHLVPPAGVRRGNFLAFDVDDAAAKYQRLKDHHVVIDRRDRRLRFGFGVYHDASDVERLLAAVDAALKD